MDCEGRTCFREAAIVIDGVALCARCHQNYVLLTQVADKPSEVALDILTN